MATSNLQILLSLRDNCSQGLKNVEKATGGLGKAAANLGKAMAIGAGAGIAVAAGALISCAKDAAEEQAAMARLQQAIGNLTGAHYGAAAGAEALVNKNLALAFSDDELRASLSLLVAQTSDYDDAVRRQAVAMDLSRGSGMDLETASRLLGKATDENTKVLQRYGVVIRDGADVTEMLAAVQAKFGGQAAAYAETAAGRWAILTNRIGEMKEAIGTALLPVATNAFGALGTLLEEHQADIERISQQVSDWLGEKIPQATERLKAGLADVMPVLQQAAGDFNLLAGVAQGFGQWLIDHQIALVAAAVAIGVAFAWANPAAGIALGVVGIAGAVELLRASVDSMPRSLLNLRLGILEVLEPTLKVIETLTDFSGLLGFLPDPLGAMARAASGLTDEAEKLANTGLADVQQNLKDTQARLAELDVRDAMGQFQALGQWTDAATASSGSLISMADMMNPALNQIDTSGATGQISNICTVADNARAALDRLVAAMAQTAISKVRDFLQGFGPQQSTVPAYQMGGIAPGGLAWVGERGPELLGLPGGSRIYSNAESRQMIRQSTTIGRQGNTYYGPVTNVIQVEGRNLEAELERLLR